jgi:GNAT superfamily N-acetyltransferase
MTGIPTRDGPTLVAVYVAPAFRGRAAGVTDALLEGIEAWARRSSTTLRLEVNEFNPRARTAYEARGFVATGRTHPHPLPPPSLELEMIKRL